MDAQNNIMRNYIVLAEDYTVLDEVDVEPEEPVVVPPDQAIMDDLIETVARLRSHMEPVDEDSTPEQALGVELGMRRAAELLEGIIRRVGERRG